MSDNATRAAGSSAPACCASDEDAIMDALRKAGFDERAMKALTVTDWTDGIDIDRPSYPLLRFVEIVRHNPPAHGRDERSVP